MRFSSVLSLCAAPLALAGTLQQDLVARGVQGLDVASSDSKSRDKDSKKSESSKSESSKDSNSDVVLVEQSVTNEVVVIWVNNGGGAATKTLTDTVTVTQNGGKNVAAATHQVTVGGSAGLVYSPPTIEAAVGDMVVFTFLSQNHTVTQSAFTEPCAKLATGMDSGFKPNLNSSVNPPPQMAMQVTVTTPLWFYCRQKGHCGKGMAFSINPTENKTQAMFVQMAIAQNGTGTASPITGGSANSAASQAPPASAVAAPPAAATSAAAVSVSTSASVASGSGTVNGGACECSCLCGTAAFPLAAQGLGGFGGMSGAMPAKLLMA